MDEEDASRVRVPQTAGDCPNFVGAAVTPETRMRLRGVSRVRGIVEGDPPRPRAENGILQELGDECFGSADTAPVVVP
jgi:hypothetical protein